MLRINDFILYIPMKGNATDYSLNGYSTTVNGATLTTNDNSISNSAYNFDGTNDYISLGTTAYDTLIDAMNAGTVSIFIKMINNKASNANDIVLALGDSNTGVFTDVLQISELTGTLNQTAIYAGSGSDPNSIYTSVAPTTATWKNIMYQTTYATTKYTGLVRKDNTDLGLIRSETKQLITKSTDGSRSIWIGWRQESPSGRSFKGNMYNFMVRKKDISTLEYKYINKFGNMKRIA